ncbi:DUF7024 domain-containing protein [Mesorhizobium sp. Root172]|uniref:DUF7024 domain-containing protein n=1 Tax=Mesorhizobium sp. Root172 TaxID=1736481 RepID=UPI000B04C987|nr:hypothetical protein [Mesorhizobium sp. Root172]
MIWTREEIARGFSATWARLIASYARNTTVFLSIILVAIGIAINFRNQGLYVVVLADEYTYSRFSRLSLPSGAPVPSYLFFFVYKFTGYCGDGFLACARYLNTILFILAAPFIFLTSSRITSKPSASLIAILSVIGAINTYTAYYMPESLYFLMFWVFSWAVLALDAHSELVEFIFVSLIFSATALVKPHSLFFLPGVILYFAYLIRQGPEQAWAAKWLRVSTVFVAVAIAAKLALGFALAGRAGATLFGPTYGSYASGAVLNLDHYAELVKLAGINLAGHLLALSILYGTPLAAVLLSMWKHSIRHEAEEVSARIAFYTLAVFSTLVVVVALFSASIANMGPYETPFRLHMRYYNFAFPLFLIFMSSQINQREGNFTLYRLISAAPVFGLIIYAIFTAMRPYTPAFVDSPELRGISYQKNIFYFISAIGMLSLFIWVFSFKFGARVFLLIFAPLSAVIGTYFSSIDLRTNLNPNVFDEAGIFAHQYLKGHDTSRLVIMSSNPSGLFRSLFYVDDPQASIVLIPAGSPADLSKVRSDKEWLLLIGDHAPPPNSHFKLDLNGFSLFRLAGSDRIDFTRRSWPGTLARVRGLSGAEGWGTWSDGPMVTLEFVKPLPKKFVLHLTASAFGPNVGRPVSVHIGSQSATFALSKSVQEIAIPFENSEASTSISFSIPNPISPKELGLNEDRRKLGIGFRQLSVQEVTQ